MGPPKELYDRPQNTFVAGFIGSPSMNFFDATVEKAEGGLKLATSFGRLPIMEPLAGRVANRVGEVLSAGLRPEDIHDPDYLPMGIRPTNIEVTADLVEHLGREVLLVARFDSRTGRPCRRADEGGPQPRQAPRVRQGVRTRVLVPPGTVTVGSVGEEVEGLPGLGFLLAVEANAMIG